DFQCASPGDTAAGLQVQGVHLGGGVDGGGRRQADVIERCRPVDDRGGVLGGDGERAEAVGAGGGQLDVGGGAGGAGDGVRQDADGRRPGRPPAAAQAGDGAAELDVGGGRPGGRAEAGAEDPARPLVLAGQAAGGDELRRAGRV